MTKALKMYNWKRRKKKKSRGETCAIVQQENYLKEMKGPGAGTRAGRLFVGGKGGASRANWVRSVVEVGVIRVESVFIV